MSNKGKKRLVIGIIIAVVLLAAAGVFWYFMGNGIKAYLLIKSYLREEEHAMTVQVSADLDNKSMDLDGEIYQTPIDGQSVVGIEALGLSIYYSDGIVILENGNAYTMTTAMMNDTEMPKRIAGVFERTQLEVTEADGRTEYIVHSEGQKALDLVSYISTDAGNYFESLDHLTLVLAEEHGQAVELTFSGEGITSNGEEVVLDIDCNREYPTDLADRVPEAVCETMKTKETVADSNLTDALVALVKAYLRMDSCDSVPATLNLSASCGLLSFQHDFDVDVKKVMNAASEISSAESDASEAADEAETSDADAEEDTSEEADDNGYDKTRIIWETAYEVCLEGNFTYHLLEDGYSYYIELDEESLEKIFTTMATEWEEYPLTVSSGDLQIVVTDGAIETISFEVQGSAKVLLLDVDAKLAGVLTFSDYVEEE